MKKLSFLLFIFCCNYLYSQDCGKERWDVKTLTDPDTLSIDFNKIRSTTIKKQISLYRPVGPHSTLYNRHKSETTVYEVSGQIMHYKLEKDKDIHVVIMDVKTHDEMVIEIVNPECSDVQQSSWYKNFVEVWNWFVENVGKPTTKFKEPTQPIVVTVQGIGFWDRLHGQRGMAENGRELHPILKINKQ